MAVSNAPKIPMWARFAIVGTLLWSIIGGVRSWRFAAVASVYAFDKASAACKRMSSPVLIEKCEATALQVFHLERADSWEYALYMTGFQIFAAWLVELIVIFGTRWALAARPNQIVLRNHSATGDGKPPVG